MAMTSFICSVSLVLSLTIQQTSGVSSRVIKPEEPTVKLQARLVNLNIKVVDTSGRPVARLNRDDFIVLENNVRQEVTYFEPVAAPVNLLLLLDLSGSIGSKLQTMKKAAKKFVDSLGRDDRIAIASFTTRFQAVSDFTTDRDKLKRSIERIVNPGGDTALYDAAWEAL